MTTAEVRADRCPGALSLHEAADGLLARVRTPGGRITGAALIGLVRLGEVELTSRANVQLRRVNPDVGDSIARLGLLPSATHERVRNIVASPRDDSPTMRGLIASLDAGVCAEPALAELSGRFLFGLDAGKGDIADLLPDALARRSADGWWIGPTSVLVRTDDVVGELLAVARGFLDGSDGAWRVRDLPDHGAALARRLRDGRALVESPTARAEKSADDVSMVQVPLGRLTPAAARTLARTGAPLRITPWRSIAVHGRVDPAELEAAGLVVGPSLWTRVSACAGRPGCAKALADVRADASAAVAAGRSAPSGDPGPRVHWSGCERRCGRPTTPHVDVLATTEGYVQT